MELAINTDCRKLIKNFTEDGNLSFATFCDQWKSMKFQHIFSAQSSTTEILQTITAMLYVAKKIFCSNEDAQDQLAQRIGALYLLYATFFKQPTRLYVKIDVTLSDWRKMREFIDNLGDGDDDDDDNEAYDETRYIFWSLHEANAFRFCAHDFHLGLENLVDYDELYNECRGGVDSLSGDHEKNTPDALEELKEFSTVSGMLPALTTLEDGYNEMKDLLVKEQAKSSSGGATIAIQALPASTIFKDIQQVFSNIRDIMDSKRGKRRAMFDELRTSSKRDLKHKGYKVTQGKVTNDAGVESTKSRRESMTTTTCRGMHRMSSKTVFAQNLPDETLQDLQGESGATDDDSADDVADDDDDDDDDDEDNCDYSFMDTTN